VDSVGRAKARQLEAERDRQTSFRQAETYAECRHVGQQQFKVEDSDLYLILDAPDQGEDYVTIFAWPYAIYECEIERGSGRVQSTVIATVADYQRAASGSRAKHLMTVLALAKEDHGLRA
jgi:hypothetical protein